MKHVLRTALLVVLMLVLVLPVQAAEVNIFVDCVETMSESGSPRVWFGYASDEDILMGSTLEGVIDDGTGLSPSFLGYAPSDLHEGTHNRVFAIEFPAPGYDVTWRVYTEAFEITVTANYDTGGAECDPADIGTGEPDGGLETITIYDVVGEAFTWEVRDVWGNWHVIDSVVTPLQCEADRCFTRLVLGLGVTTDADDYHVTAIEPPEATE